MTGIVLGLALLLGAAAGWAGVTASAAFAGIAVVGGGRRMAWSITLIPLALIGCLRVFSQEGPGMPGLASGEFAFEGVVDSRPVENGRTQRFELAVDGGDSDAGDPYRLCASVPVAPEVGFKDRIQVVGDVRWIDDLDNRTASYVASKRCAGTLNARETRVLDKSDAPVVRLDDLRRRITAALQQAATGDSGALLAGLVTGDDAALPFDRRNHFMVTGTSHITAVSGSNLAVIVTIFAFTGGAAGYARRWHWQTATIAALWLYVGVIGPSPPPLRAACVASLAIVAQALGRRADLVTLSVLVAAVELVWRPEDLESLAFRLSTVSAIALVLALSGRSPRGWRGWLGQSAFATAATQAATSAFLVPVFGRFAIYAIPANVLIAPICAVAFPLALLAGLAGLVSSTMAAAIAAPAAVLAAVILTIVEIGAAMPGADAGSSIGGSLDGWVWAVVGVAAVVMLSKECRGGLVRAALTLRETDDRTRAVLASSVTGAIVGAVAAALVR